LKYILDTCSYYWLVDDQTKLSPAALSIIGDSANSLHVSAITVTEIHRLVRKGKISINAPTGLDDWFRKGFSSHLVACEAISFEVAHAAEVLPSIHNDPADRFILATAQVIGATVLSPDTIMPKYPGITVAW